MENKEDIARNIRILAQRLQQLCCVLRTLQVSMRPELILSLYFYQQSLTQEVKQQLRKYVADDNDLSELLQQRLFELSLNELLWENLIMPEIKTNK